MMSGDMSIDISAGFDRPAAKPAVDANRRCGNFGSKCCRLATGKDGMSSRSKIWLLIMGIPLLLIGCSQNDLPATSIPARATTFVAATANPPQSAEATPTAASSPTSPPLPVATQALPTGTSSPPPATVDQLSAELADLPLDQFFEASYKQLLLRSPETITYYGLAGSFGMRDDQLDNLSDAYIHETQQLERTILDLLHGFDRAALEPEQKISYDVFEWYLDSQVRGHEFIYYDYPLHHFIGSYSFSLNQLFTETHPLRDVQNVEDYIARLGQVNRQAEQLLAGLALRAEQGIRPPRFILEMTRVALLRDLGANSTDPDRISSRVLPVYIRLNVAMDEIEMLGDEAKSMYRDAALEAIEASLVPAYLALIDYVDAQMPLANDDAGVWQFDRGDDYYQHRLYVETSTDLTAAEIYEMGLAEVERIHAELRILFAELGYPDDEPVGVLLNRASVEAGYFDTSNAANQAQLVTEIEAILADMDQRMEPVFGIRPAVGVNVVGLTAASGGGFYEAPALDGSRAGTYYAGVGGPRVSLFDLKTVAYHEAIPGHHTQIALAQELELPTFRRLLFFNAYGEGWALYGERLALELGVYEDDPYGNIGRLQLELLRAVRLVVDSGIHAQRWSRAEAIAYMNEELGSWTQEVDRYIVWPAQSTGYMVGMLKILELRQKAMDALGDRFDLRQFHNVVLGNGSMPLAILERLVDEYIKSAQ